MAMNAVEVGQDKPSFYKYELCGIAKRFLNSAARFKVIAEMVLTGPNILFIKKISKLMIRH